MTALFLILAVLAFADKVEAADTCPEGWEYYDVTDSCYVLFNEPLDYFQAIDACGDYGATLATPHTMEQLDFVFELMGFSDAWIGLDDIATEGTFLFQDGQELQYDAWYPGSPTGRGDWNCVVGDAYYGAMADTTCTSVFAYVCQLPLSPDPCEGVTCANGGVCNSDTGAAVCDCPAEYTGERCEEETQVPDPCEGVTCANGGVCNSDTGAAVCDCPAEYTGERCEEETQVPDPCEDFCQNDGVCNSDTGAAVCDCPTDYTGERCEVKTITQACDAECTCPKGLKCIEVYASCHPRSSCKQKKDIPSCACLPKKCTDCNRKAVCDHKGTRVHCTSREAESVD